MDQLPRISIVTPSFNQGKYLEETIKSIIDQNYPNLEYIVMDGGSTDNSLDILKKYQNYLTYWESHPDNGQADAIHRGFTHATGDILCYINSDDYFLPDALWEVARTYINNPSLKWMAGEGIFVNEARKYIKKRKYLPICYETMLYFENCIFQPASFWRRDFYFQTGGIDTKLRFSFDYDLFMKFIVVEKPIIVHREIAAFRVHAESKTSTISDIGLQEHMLIRNRYLTKETNKIKRLLLSVIGKGYRKIPFGF